MHKIIFKILLSYLFLALINGSQFALGEEKSGPTDSSKKTWRLSLGYGMAFKNNIRKDNNYKGSHSDILFNQIPLIQVAWGPISIGAQGLMANLIGNREVAGYLNLNRAGDRYYATGMESIKESYFFGLGIKIHKFNGLISRDINGRSKGIKATFHYSSIYPLGEKISARSSMGFECYDKAFAEYYYSVQSNETNSTRSEYHPKAYCLPTASFFPSYKYSEDLNLLTGVAFKVLSKTVRQSPTTDGSWLETTLILGATWKF